MCGITGFIGKGSREDLRLMTRALTHRGPDDEGFWIDDEHSVYLGHRRLEILDIAGGKQPMWTHDGNLAILFNGEIYNHLELRRELERRGHVFLSDHSDTETLLYGFREWGPAIQQKLNGMWAFAIYDRERRRLFCSRDRFGQKPLYYTLQGECFAFASELRSLQQHHALRTEPNPQAIKKYFAHGYIPAPHALYRHCYKLPGGHCLFFDVDRRELKISRYWEFELAPEEISERDEPRLRENLRALIETAVTRRLAADVPLGVFLSGGIDSSTIARFAARQTPPGQLNTFAVGFRERSYDESAYARAVASFLGTRHHEEVLSWENARAIMTRVAARLDEPNGDGSIIPCYLLGGFARERVTVVLSGDGADELLAGYDPFRALRWADLYAKWTPRPVHRAIRLLSAHLPVSHHNISLPFKIQRTLRGLSHDRPFWLPTWMGALDHERLEALFEESIDPDDLYSEALDLWERAATTNLVDQTLVFFTRHYLQDSILFKIDRANMLHGLEARSPFLDIDLVNFVRTLPHSFKLRRGTTKYLLKKAMVDHLPANTIKRRKKGFGMPIGLWMKNETMPPAPAVDLPLSFRFVEEKYREHRNGSHDHRQFLWSHWMLSHYLGNGESAP